MPNWPVFWFETNSAWGLVNSQEVWAAMRAAWNELGTHLSKLIDRAKVEMKTEGNAKAIAATEGLI